MIAGSDHPVESREDRDRRHRPLLEAKVLIARFPAQRQQAVGRDHVLPELMSEHDQALRGRDTGGLELLLERG